MDQTILKDAPAVNSTTDAHPLSDKWTLWAHLPHDTDWSFKSYKKIMTVATVEDMLVLYNNLSEKLLVNCMLFFMRDGIKPIWEDKMNKDGGCFSYRVQNKFVPKTWTKLSYATAGETLCNDKKILSSINGVTISPKKHFCIIKIWLKNCLLKDPTVIMNVGSLTANGCLFKKHINS
tara:strand:- start:1287 stop:1817 length:531 start_codon:yes stop_codon:yes gene_type:complete